MGNHILITGGAGFIGSHLADALLRRGHEVRALDNLSPQVHGASVARPAKPRGSEASFAPSWHPDGKRLIVLDQAESPLYFANLELRTLHRRRRS